jgi:riboflavin kinase/FMN adenylyltransferase
MTIGKFDGLHLGHQQMIGVVVERARSQNVCSAVLTFDPHPGMVLRPQHSPRLLTSLEERIELIAALNVDVMIVAPFNRETMATPAYDYMQQICTAVPLRELWVGEQFALGRKREGNIPRLAEIGQELGYTVHKLDPVLIGGERISSSRVRAMLSAGDVAGVEKLLGRFFRLHSIVVEGDRRGRTIGFPTANLAVNEQHALPADGVYACYAHVEGQAIAAVTNIGVRPTFGELRRTVEAHLLDWSGDLYGRMIWLEFRHHLRGEHKFGGIDELKAQISRDAMQARALLSTEG